ncbi:MAG: hypothetical protein LQ346_003789 [Caloplaca aetnensis]|nr:MAG: hypothetical protein LQ346_003789 [Caloplaca aetnensis]
MAESTSDISITSNKVATGILFGIALIAYAARTYIRTFVVKQFLVEDACYGPAGNSRVIRDTAAATAIDVITDIMVLSFPIILLWEVRVDVRQKFALGISLCLSIVMIVVAIIRISAFRLTNGEVDMVWLAFWQQQESSIAITVVSISAFRSLFVAASVNGPIRRPFRQSVNEWRRKVERRRIGPTTNDQEMPVFGTLPRVPSPTLTGMSSLLRRL